jgi:hypothetical protein
MGNEILNPNWSSWDSFYLEYDAWVKDYMATPASAGKFFSGGEILPDGSTVLEDYTYEVFTASTAGTGSIPHNVELYDGHKIPRTRTDMHRLRRTEFYKQYISDIEKARSRDPDDVDLWIDNFKKISPQFEEDE